jgi:hypothetical protein
MSAETKQLLVDYLAFEYTPDMISESKQNNEGKVFLKGILQKSDTLNQNGRIYPRPILEREIRNYQKFILEGRALGELDHPDSSVVELKNASHVIREAYVEGNVVYGTVELLNTPSGKILQSLLESGVTLGISSRGVGSTKKSGNQQIVQDDFQLICWDFVSEPSTPGAFMVKESKIHTSELNKIFTKSDRIDRILNDIIDWE